LGGAYEVTGTNIKKYYSIAGMTVAMKDGSGLQYLLTDHLGSVVAVTDASGTLTSQQRYLPFGQVRTDLNGPRITGTDFGYTGQRNISYINLLDYKSRWYDPLLGRFISPDSIIPDPSNPQSINRYTYVLNQPTNLNDPTGHCFSGAIIDTVLCVAAAAAIVAILTSGGSNVTPEALTASANQQSIAHKYETLQYNNKITNLEQGAKLVSYAAKQDSGCTSCFVKNVGAVLSGGSGILQPFLVDLTKNKSLASPYYSQGIGQSGFSSVYQDPVSDSGGGNQLHHYWYYVQVGYETDNRDLGYGLDWFHEHILGDPKGMSSQDLILGHQGIDTGLALRNGTLKPRDVGQWMLDTLSSHGIMHAQ